MKSSNRCFAPKLLTGAVSAAAAALAIDTVELFALSLIVNHAIRRGDLNAAAQLFRKVVDANSEHVAAWRALSNVLAELGDRDGAGEASVGVAIPVLRNGPIDDRRAKLRAAALRITSVPSSA